MNFNLLPKTSSRQTQGARKERDALEYLQAKGLRCLTCNYRSRFGEIDIIAEDGDTLVFVEVRFRKNNHFGSALESVTAAKQKKIRLTAQQYLAKHKIGETRPTRFDVVGITAADIQWIQHAF